MPKQRPKYLNLLQIKLPVMGIVSILHRLTGLLLILSIPFLIYLLDVSLSSPEGFLQAQTWLSWLPIKLFMVFVIWGLCHHLLAGIRFLLLDVHIGVDRTSARKTAWLVNMLSGLSLLLILGVLL